MTEFPLNDDCFVTSVTLPFLRKAGDAAFDWDPFTVRDAFESLFSMEKMPQRLFDKLNCGLALIGTDSFTSTIEGFLASTAVMNNMRLDADFVPFVTLEHCAWSVWEYINLNGDMDSMSRPTETFSQDIIKYIQSAAALNGVIRFPEWLKFAQPPDSAVPDLSDDVQLFETYMSRQQDYVADLAGMVSARQAALAGELKTLEAAGLVG